MTASDDKPQKPFNKPSMAGVDAKPECACTPGNGNTDCTIHNKKLARHLAAETKFAGLKPSHDMHGACNECVPPKPDATPREWKVFGICAAEKGSAAFEAMQPPFVHVIEKSYADALKQRVAELEQELIDKRATQDAIWVHRFSDEGKRKTAVSWDGAISSAYQQYVPAKELTASRGALDLELERSREIVSKLAAAQARVAELEGQLKAKVNLDTVFVATAYEDELTDAKAMNNECYAKLDEMEAEIENSKEQWQHDFECADKYAQQLTQANARIESLETELRMTNEVSSTLALKRIKDIEREQKLVAALETADSLYADDKARARVIKAALAEHKGGG